MKRKHKSYSKPKTRFEKTRILEEEIIKKEFGLKNKREIWKAEAKIKVFRERAKNLISANHEEQQGLFNKLKKQGFNVNSIADVLSLDKKDYLKRRLQTVLVEKKLATTSRMARQLIVHKKVLVDGKIVSIPSYIIPVELENKITLKISKPKIKKKTEETKENSEENEQDGE
jgi:small subunit ribosomal protein S4